MNTYRNYINHLCQFGRESIRDLTASEIAHATRLYVAEYPDNVRDLVYSDDAESMVARIADYFAAQEAGDHKAAHQALCRIGFLFIKAARREAMKDVDRKLTFDRHWNMAIAGFDHDSEGKAKRFAQEDVA